MLCMFGSVLNSRGLLIAFRFQIKNNFPQVNSIYLHATWAMLSILVELSLWKEYVIYSTYIGT